MIKHEETKMKSIKIVRMIFLIISASFFSVQAQEISDYKFIISSESKLWFEGTSTLHDYKCVANEVTGSLMMKKSILSSFATGINDEIISGVVHIPVLSIKSGKNKMDKKMWKSLKADQFSEILYELTSAELIRLPDAENNQLLIKTIGILKVSGVEKNIEMEVTGSQSESGNIKFSGNKKLLMTDFNIKPPTMFLGTIKTGNEITVYFELVLIPSDRYEISKIGNFFN